MYFSKGEVGNRRFTTNPETKESETEKMKFPQDAFVSYCQIHPYKKKKEYHPLVTMEPKLSKTNRTIPTALKPSRSVHTGPLPVSLERPISSVKNQEKTKNTDRTGGAALKSVDSAPVSKKTNDSMLLPMAETAEKKKGENAVKYSPKAEKAEKSQSNQMEKFDEQHNQKMPATWPLAPDFLEVCIDPVDFFS